MVLSPVSRSLISIENLMDGKIDGWKMPPRVMWGGFLMLSMPSFRKSFQPASQGGGGLFHPEAKPFKFGKGYGDFSVFCRRTFAISAKFPNKKFDTCAVMVAYIFTFNPLILSKGTESARAARRA